MVRFGFQIASLLLLATGSEAFTTLSTRALSTAPISTRLFNVPPPGTDSDPQTIKDKADREAPPQSFYQLQVNCARAAELAIKDGHKLIEVEVSKISSTHLMIYVPAIILNLLLF